MTIEGSLFVIVFLFFGLSIYFFPLVVAINRGTAEKSVIFFVNLVLGWTVIGWCFAMLLACTAQTTTAREIEIETLRKLKEK